MLILPRYELRTCKRAVAAKLGEPGGNATVERIADFEFADTGGLP